MATRRTTVWIDASGRTTAHLLTTLVSGAAIEAAIGALSNAAPQLRWEGALVAPGGAGINAAFPNVSDTATLTFTKASGQLLKLAIPAPLASIFLADTETVDPTQIVALIAAVVGSLCDPAGNVATAYVSGIRNTPS